MLVFVKVRNCVETQYAGRPSPDFLPWANSTPFEITPPPQGDSMDSISDLLCLNMPRGSLLGNANPLLSNVALQPVTENNLPAQVQPGGVSLRYGYSQVRCDQQNILNNRKVMRNYEGGFQSVSPICPPPINSPLHYSFDCDTLLSNRNSPDDENSLSHILSHSPTDSSVSKSSSEPSSGMTGGMFCPTTEQELTNLQNLYTLRKQHESDLMSKIIEQTSRLILAAAEHKRDDSSAPFYSYPYCPEKFLRIPRPFYSEGLESELHQQSILSTKPFYLIQTVPQKEGNNRNATYTWSGQLPPRVHKNPTYSCKVFLGGVPWDITEAALVQAFHKFGPIKVEWPGKELAANQPKGYAYIILETEKKVKALLDYCTHDYSKGGNWYYKISSRKMKSKEVQVIPWAVSDSNFAHVSQKLDPQKTVFVGALHGMINAHALAQIMNDLFGGVVYAGLDTDKHKYPIGSGRVTFSDHESYMQAVVAAFIEIKTKQFSKKVQVDPYLEDSPCSTCSVQQGPYFCREMVCFRYYCRGCWSWQHSSEGMRQHKYISRNSKNSNITPLYPPHII